MTQQEFEQRTGFITTPELYTEIEAEYMASELDKDKFCKVWIKQGGIEEMSNRMRGQILTLRRELAEERRKREAEREHADKELKRLVKAGSLLKSEGESVEKILMRNDPDDGVQGGATLWKLTQAITAHARELEPRRSRELHEISGALLNRVKVTA